MKPSLSVAAYVAALSVGCASSVPPPTDPWAAAQADIGRAEASGAATVPDAKLHLQLAEEDLQTSHQLMGRDNRRSGTLAALARSEAQLAVSLTRQSAAQDAAMKAQGDLQSARGAAAPPNGATNAMPPSPTPPAGDGPMKPGREKGVKTP